MRRRELIRERTLVQTTGSFLRTLMLVATFLLLKSNPKFVDWWDENLNKLGDISEEGAAMAGAVSVSFLLYVFFKVTQIMQRTTNAITECIDDEYNPVNLDPVKGFRQIVSELIIPSSAVAGLIANCYKGADFAKALHMTPKQEATIFFPAVLNTTVLLLDHVMLIVKNKIAERTDARQHSHKIMIPAWFAVGLATILFVSLSAAYPDKLAEKGFSEEQVTAAASVYLLISELFKWRVPKKVLAWLKSESLAETTNYGIIDGERGSGSTPLLTAGYGTFAVKGMPEESGADEFVESRPNSVSSV